jgi:hypothetical protein
MSAYGFALAFFFVVFWAEEVATVTLCLAALAIIAGGSFVDLPQSQRGARSSRFPRAVYLADHPRLDHLSAAVLLAWREATRTVDAVGTVEAARTVEKATEARGVSRSAPPPQ